MSPRTSVSGSGYGNISTYASNIEYRAWGAVRGMSYGNNPLSQSATFDARMQVSQFELAGRPPAYGTSTVMKAHADYYADGALKFAHQLVAEDEKFDRAFTYDQVSMLSEAYSGSEARDVLSLTANLESTIKLSALGLNPKGFKRIKDPELDGYWRYENVLKGISYAVAKDGHVYSISRVATKKDDEALRCRR